MVSKLGVLSLPICHFVHAYKISESEIYHVQLKVAELPAPSHPGIETNEQKLCQCHPHQAESICTLLALTTKKLLVTTKVMQIGGSKSWETSLGSLCLH